MRYRLSRLGRGSAAAVAAVTVTAGLATFATAPTANAAATVTVNRISGATRYDTSAMIAETKYPTGVVSGNVVLATGTAFPDALSANYLAGQLSAPILLSPTTASDPSYATVTTALSKLLVGTTKNVFIVGGAVAVGPDIAADLTTKGYKVTRISGATRYDTNQAANTQTGQVPGVGVSGNKTAIIATGTNYPDALGAGPLSWNKHFPIILTDGTQTTLGTQATATLTTLGIKNVLIMGGASAINPALNTAITGMGITIDKQFSGVDRTDTAAQLATYEIANYGFSNAQSILASGGNFPDALSAGPWGGDPQFLALTEPDLSLGTYTTNLLKGLNVTMATINIPGGTAAVPAATATAAQTAATLGGANGTFTTGPEVVNASILQTVTLAQATPTQPAGTYVQYLFDEPISAGSPNAAFFGVYHSGAPQAPVVGAVASVSTSNPSAVVVIFPTLNTAALAADLTLAAVNAGGVLDLQAQTNPIGAAAIGTSGSSSNGAAGVTLAPDLVSVSGFRQACTVQVPAVSPCTATSGMTAVDFTFDKPATLVAATTVPTPTPAAAALPPPPVDPGGVLTLVLSTGFQEACATPTVADLTTASGGNTPGGNGTTVITAICSPATATPTAPLTASQVARGIVKARSVVDTATGTFANPLQATTAPHTASTNPTLVSGMFQPNTSSASCGIAGLASPCDIALYNFDQAVTGALGAPNLFHVYSAAGESVPPAVVTGVVNPTFVQLSTASPNTIAGFFPAGTLSTGPMVGLSVETMAVSSPNASIGQNQTDEVGVANGATTTQTPGSTAGPDLINVTQSAVKDAFGTVLAYAETATFNKPLGSATTPFLVGNVTNPGGFIIWESDNTPFACTATAAQILASWSSANAASVTCSSWGAATLNQQTQAVSAGVLGIAPPGGAPGAAFVTSALTGFPSTFGYQGITGSTGTPGSG